MSVSVDDMNWNALEWDRAAEELTWERVTVHASASLIYKQPQQPNFTNLIGFLSVFPILSQMLGLDGSLVFLVSFLSCTLWHFFI